MELLILLQKLRLLTHQSGDIPFSFKVYVLALSDDISTTDELNFFSQERFSTEPCKLCSREASPERSLAAPDFFCR